MPRFNRRGQERVYFLTALASRTAPSAAAVVGATATRLDTVLRAITGFNYTGEDLDASDMSSTWGKTIPGGDTAGDSSFTFYEGDADADHEEVVRLALAKGMNGFVIFSPRGVPAVGKPAKVWPVRVKSNNSDETAENATATFTVGMSIPEEPELEAEFAA